MGIGYNKVFSHILFLKKRGFTAMAKRKKRKEAPTGVKLLLLGTLIMTVIFLALSLLFSFIAYTTADPLYFIGLLSIAALMITAAASGFLEARLGEGSVLTPFLSSLLFVLIMLLIGLIASGGAVPLGCIINYASFVALATLSALLGKKSLEKSRRRYA